MPLNDLEGVQLHLSAKEGWIFMSVAWGVVSVVVVLAFLKEFVFGRCSCCQRGRERLSFDEIARYGSRGKLFHTALCVLFLSKLTSVLLVWAASCELLDQRCSNVLFSLTESALFFFLLLFSTGWSTLSCFNLMGAFSQAFCYLTLVFVSFFFLFFFLARTALFILHAFFLPLVFSHLTKNTAYLQFRVAWVESMEDQVHENEAEAWSYTLKSLASKLYAFRWSQIFLMLYLFGYLLATFSLIFFLEDYDQAYSLFLQGNSLWFTLSFYWLVSPGRTKEGLFWIPSFEDGWGDSTVSGWAFEGQQAIRQINSMKVHRKRTIAYAKAVVKHTYLVQYPQKQQCIEKEDNEEEEFVRNVYLAVLMSKDHEDHEEENDEEG